MKIYSRMKAKILFQTHKAEQIDDQKHDLHTAY